MEVHNHTRSPEDSDCEDSSAQGLISDEHSEVFGKRKFSGYNIKWLAAVTISFFLGITIGVQLTFFVRQTRQNTKGVGVQCLEQNSYFCMPISQSLRVEY